MSYKLRAVHAHRSILTTSKPQFEEKKKKKKKSPLSPPVVHMSYHMTSTLTFLLTQVAEMRVGVVLHYVDDLLSSSDPMALLSFNT